MKAYIFDLDGTLLDSMHIWEQIDIDFLIGRGLSVPPDYLESVSALSFPEAAAYTIERFNLPDSPENLLTEWNNMAIYAYGHTIPMKPYAKDYLDTLKKSKIKLGIATSLPEKLYLPALHHHGIEHYFDVICSTDEVACGKTHPDIFILTAKKFGVAPDECTLFEDILPAVKSGKKAGMTVYGVFDEASADDWDEIRQTADGFLYDFREAPLP